jgi:lysophospholipase L1-like esterase
LPPRLFLAFFAARLGPGPAAGGRAGREETGVLPLVVKPSRCPRLTALLLLACLGLTGVALAGAAPKHRKPTRRPVKPAPQAVAGIENAQALETFFAALRTLATPGGDRVVRVMHFGDSHTAADYWTGRIRARLQARFGDGGPGLILPARPWRGYHHEGVDQLEGTLWPGTSLREKTGDGLVGCTGGALFPPQGGTFRLRAAFGEYRVQVLGEAIPEVQVEPVLDPSAPILESRPWTLERPLENLPPLRLSGQSGFPSATLQELAITFPPGSRFLGLDLRSGHGGVIYDELGLNGAELLDLERWNPELRRALLGELRPDLLVLAYGTNDLGRTDLEPQDYVVRARALFAALKQDSGAAILVIGPLDRIGTRRRQVPALKAGAARIIRALREAARGAGCAFWDARRAMGGEGSIVRLRRAGLAQKDLVHLTGPGYVRLGDQLTDALLTAYERLGRDLEPQ